MKNAVGRCPKCSSFIKVDLSAPEVRCPECGALLRKSSKTVAEVEAERERKRRLAAGLPEVEEQVAAPVEETVAPVAEEPIPETPAEEVSAPATPVAEEPAAEETMSEEEAMALAASFDETAEEPVATAEETPASEAESEIPEETAETPVEPVAEEVNPNEISDEELAMMDEDIPDDIAKEEPTVYGSVSLEDEVPEAPAEETEEAEEAEAPQEEEALGEGLKDLSSEDDAETPDLEVEAAPETEEPLVENPLPETSPSETEATNDLFSDSPLEDVKNEEKTEEPSLEEAAPEADIEIAEEPVTAEPVAEPVVESAEEIAEPVVEPAEEVVETPAPIEESATETAEAPEAPADEATEEIPAKETPADADIKEEIPAETPVEMTEESAPVAEAEVAPAPVEEQAPVPEELTLAEEPKEEAPLTLEEEPKAEEESSGEDDEYSLDAALASAEAAAPATKEPEASAETPAEQASEEEPAYSDEDFAAAGEIDVRNYAVKKRTAKSAHEVARALRVAEEKQQKKEKETSTKNNLFARPVAALIFAFSILFVLFDFAYGLFVRNAAAATYFLAGNYAGAAYAEAPALISLLPASLIETILSKLPVFGGDLFLTIITAIYYGLIAVIAVLGITGKKGRVGSVLLLVADIVIALFRLWTLNGGAFFFIPYDGLPTILASYGAYILAGGYGILLAAAALYIASFARAKDDYAFSFKAGIPALVYAALVLLGGAALIVLPIVKADFALGADIIGYALMGIVGLSIVMTLIGVNKKDLSRSANGYLAAFLLAAASCLFLVTVLLPVFTEMTVASLVRVGGVLPATLLIAAAGFSMADIRN
ncbi:MAG: hypothetical protein J6Y74_03980 [Clostridia bacterium]|nr:hypothetical protein [Clostridia bacterium]